MPDLIPLFISNNKNKTQCNVTLYCYPAKTEHCCLLLKGHMLFVISAGCYHAKDSAFVHDVSCGICLAIGCAYFYTQC